MSLLVVGSIAFDSIKTPQDEVQEILGGSAVYFSLAARFFGPVRLVGIVGRDFPPEHLEMLSAQGVDTEGVEIAEGKTFRWSGEYFEGMNRRETLSVELNVLEEFRPKIPQRYLDSEFVFLANGPVTTQLSVLEQMEKPGFVVADTMDLWIREQREELDVLLQRIDALVLNDSESLLFTGKRNLLQAGREILELGPSRVVIKKGEHGALLVTREKVCPLPAYPVAVVRDPTGAGDCFAGGLMGYLARAGNAETETFKAALACATVISSFDVEDFGVRRLLATSRQEVQSRFQEYCSLLRVESEGF